MTGVDAQIREGPHGLRRPTLKLAAVWRLRDLVHKPGCCVAHLVAQRVLQSDLTVDDLGRKVDPRRVDAAFSDQLGGARRGVQGLAPERPKANTDDVVQTGPRQRYFPELTTAVRYGSFGGCSSGGCPLGLLIGSISTRRVDSPGEHQAVFGRDVPSVFLEYPAMF